MRRLVWIGMLMVSLSAGPVFGQVSDYDLSALDVEDSKKPAAEENFLGSGEPMPLLRPKTKRAAPLPSASVTPVAARKVREAIKAPSDEALISLDATRSASLRVVDLERRVADSERKVRSLEEKIRKMDRDIDNLQRR